MSRESDLIAKLTAFVDARFGGDRRQCWQHYADVSGEIGLAELNRLFKDASIGSTRTRSLIGKEVIRRMDANGNGKIGYDEFEEVVNKEGK